VKHILLISLLILSAGSLIAMKLKPTGMVDNKPVITWASDANPSRTVQIGLFNQTNDRFRVQLDANNNAPDKVFVQTMAGVGPTTFDSGRWRLVELAEAGMLLDVTDELARRGITIDRFLPIARDAISLNGRIVGAPGNVWGDALWFHRDIFDEAGIPYPPESGLTFDQFVELGKKLTVRDEQGRTVRFGVMGLTYYQLLLTNGGRVLSADGRRCVLDRPEAIDALQKYVDLQRVHRIAPTPEDEQSISSSGGWGSGPITLFRDKRAAMAVGGRWWLCTYRTLKGPDGRFPLRLGVSEPPTTLYRRYHAGSRVIYANAMAPDADRAVEFLEFLSGDGYADLINLDGDALPGTISGLDRESYFHDPAKDVGGDGGGSLVWRRVAEHGISDDLTPYIPRSRVDQILNKQISLATQRNNPKSPRDALTDAARQVNEEIRFNVSRNVKLKERFDRPDTSPVYNNAPDADPRDARGTP
jgi:multiple sugar transport system substrate-binding protein